MGQDCCTNRLKPQILSTSHHQNDITSQFSQTTFNPFKKSISISFLYFLTGNYKMILEIAESCSKNHICCYFDPDYLQKQHSLIEFQSPGSSFHRDNLATAFWNDIEYLYEENIFSEVFKFKVILIIEVQGKGKHALTISGCMDPSNVSYFIVYDIQNRNRTYREKMLQDESSLNEYLNKIGEHYFVSYSPQPVSIKLLTFQYIDDKTESDIENLVHNNSQLTSNNNNNNMNMNTNQTSQYSIHSQQQMQQQQQSSSFASIQQQQQQQQQLQQGNQIPLHIQLQSLPQAQSINMKLGSISSIRSFQSLNQQGVSLPMKLTKNLSQNASEQVAQLIIQQQQQSQQLCQGQDQFIIQINQQENYHLPTHPTQSVSCRAGSMNHNFFFSNNNNSLSTGIPMSKCSCGFKQKIGINQISQIDNDESWEQEDGESKNVINYCSNNQMNYHQNAEEILENGQCPSSASVQFINDEDQEEDAQTPYSFNFQGKNNIIHCGAQQFNELFISDDEEFQICIQSGNDQD